MGIPYSREINAAFEQVTPLVAAGYQVLRTTKNISILLAVIQVLTVVLLFLVWIALIALMYCVNPDLEVRSVSFLLSFDSGVIPFLFLSILFLSNVWCLFGQKGRR